MGDHLSCSLRVRRRRGIDGGRGKASSTGMSWGSWGPSGSSVMVLGARDELAERWAISGTVGEWWEVS